MSEKDNTETNPPNAEEPTQPSSEAQAGDPNDKNGPNADASATPSEQAPETPASRGLETSGLRFGDDPSVPSWARGRTAKELLDVTSQLYDVVQRGETTPTTSTSTPQHDASMNAPSPPSNGDGIPQVDPDLIYSNPKEYHRQMEMRQNAIIDAKLQQAAGSITSPLASMAKTQAKSHRPEVWERYGPEIESTMASMPAEARGNVETWKRIVNYVAGEHVDELVAAKAEELVARGTDTGILNSSSGPPRGTPPTSSNPIKRLFDEGHPAVRGFVDDRISPDQVISHAQARGYDLETYAKMLKDRAERRGARV